MLDVVREWDPGVDDGRPQLTVIGVSRPNPRDRSPAPRHAPARRWRVVSTGSLHGRGHDREDLLAAVSEREVAVPNGSVTATATAWNTWSPTGCPSESLIRLKWSMSIISTAAGPVSRGSAKARRLSSPVSGSCSTSSRSPSPRDQRPDCASLHRPPCGPGWPPCPAALELRHQHPRRRCLEHDRDFGIARIAGRVRGCSSSVVGVQPSMSHRTLVAGRTARCAARADLGPRSPTTAARARAPRPPGPSCRPAGEEIEDVLDPRTHGDLGSRRARWVSLCESQHHPALQRAELLEHRATTPRMSSRAEGARGEPGNAAADAGKAGHQQLAAGHVVLVELAEVLEVGGCLGPQTVGPIEATEQVGGEQDAGREVDVTNAPGKCRYGVSRKSSRRRRAGRGATEVFDRPNGNRPAKWRSSSADPPLGDHRDVSARAPAERRAGSRRRRGRSGAARSLRCGRAPRLPAPCGVWSRW